MPLFKTKKQPVVQPVQMIESPEYTMESIQHRVELLLQAEKKLQARIARFEENTSDLVENAGDKLREVRNELVGIASEYKAFQERFAVIVKALSFTAKQEDFQKTKRIIDQYDPADIITRKEFERF